MSNGFVTIYGLCEEGATTYSFIGKASNLRVAVGRISRLHRGKETNLYKWLNELKIRGGRFDCKVLQVLPESKGKEQMDAWAVVLSYMGSKLLNEEYRHLLTETKGDEDEQS